ncbi:metal ABC transporter solute-binding protein, Zn/Mn family [Salinicoccus roseus]|uniref:metal ABC transporter solute-binding protein, Zn/Mn family n=1 Tax=Salinicoccus roseus TaxID=45670 RepID=UPI002301F8C0|nr:zinc ABC transporter substrate-binding protein [Salinicoccus roseus]
MKKYLFPGLMALLVMALAACGSSTTDSNETDDDVLTIYTTVFPLKSFAEQIGGGSVSVETIYPNGADIHTYEPTQKDMLEYAEGDLFIYTADDLDPVSQKIRGAVEDHTVFFPAADGIPEEAFEHDHGHEEAEEGHEDDHDHESEEGHEDHGHENGTDPHIWLDPNLSIEMASAIKDQLVEMDPDNASDYTENFEALEQELTDIDAELASITEDPLRDTVYISHESIGYLADRYHFEQVGISGLNNQEPSQQELTHIIEDIEAKEIPYILYEQNITSKITDTIREETNTEPLEFHNLSVLNDEDDQEATYQSIMQDNIEVLDRVLNE